MKSVFVYLPELFADWEIGFILPELREAGIHVTTVAETMQPIKSMGGLTVLPDVEVSKADFDKADLIIFCGSDTWAESNKNEKIQKLMPEFHTQGKLIAGICGATTAMARAGLLDNIKHTGNLLMFMKSAVPTYTGEALYQSQLLAVQDKNVITASGAGPIEFAYEILKALKVYDQVKLQSWFDFFKHAVIPKEWLVPTK